MMGHAWLVNRHFLTSVVGLDIVSTHADLALANSHSS